MSPLSSHLSAMAAEDTDDASQSEPDFSDMSFSYIPSPKITCSAYRPKSTGPLDIPSVPQTAQTNKACIWAKRSVATRTTQNVSEEVERLTAGMRLFQNQPPCSDEWTMDNSSTPFAQFHRKEVITGNLIGRGAFSDVRVVDEIEVDTSHRGFDIFEIDARERLSASCSPQLIKPCRYVIKHLRSNLKEDSKKFDQCAADLVMEAKMLARLSHPNIIKVRGWAAGGADAFADGSNDGYFMILDKLDETLTQRINRWRQEDPKPATQMHQFATKLRYAFQIASALDYLHDRGLVYRDLKPDNVGFQGDSVQLFDFGLCRELSKANSPENKVYKMSGVGTRRYLAPEVALHAGPQAYNQKVDVYSLAIVMYEMLSLQKPFDVHNAEIHQILVCEGCQRPVMPPYWPMNVRCLLEDAWSQDPAKRPSMKKLKARLPALIDEAERQLLSPAERTVRVIFELDDLFASAKGVSSSEPTARTVTASSSFFSITPTSS